MVNVWSDPLNSLYNSVSVGPFISPATLSLSLSEREAELFSLYISLEIRLKFPTYSNTADKLHSVTAGLDVGRDSEIILLEIPICLACTSRRPDSPINTTPDLFAQSRM